MRLAYLAIATGIVGTLITIAVVGVCQILRVDISTHLWVLAIPITLSLIINISLLELWDKLKKG